MSERASLICWYRKINASCGQPARSNVEKPPWFLAVGLKDKQSLRIKQNENKDLKKNKKKKQANNNSEGSNQGNGGRKFLKCQALILDVGNDGWVRVCSIFYWHHLRYIWWVINVIFLCLFVWWWFFVLVIFVVFVCFYFCCFLMLFIISLLRFWFCLFLLFFFFFSFIV